MLRKAKLLIGELMGAETKEQLVFMLLIEDIVFGRMDPAIEAELQRLRASAGYAGIFAEIKDEIMAFGVYLDEGELKVFMAGEKLKRWLNGFYALNAEKQAAVYGAIMILIGFMDYRTAERYLEKAALRDAEVNNLMDLLFECYAE